MPKSYGYSFTLAALMALTVGFVFQADAGLLVFTSRDAWQSALGRGGDFQINFSPFVGMSFAESALNFGPFSLSTIGSVSTLPLGSNAIVGPPFDDVNPSVDGTAYASMFLDSAHSVALDFSKPMTAFSGDFGAGLYPNFGVFLSGRRTVEYVEVPADHGPFFGVISTDSFDRILFGYNGPPDGSSNVKLDNVIGASVPEPASLMIMGAGVTLLAAYSCWSLRRGKDEGSPDRT